MVTCSHCSTVNHPDNVVCSNCGMPLMPDPALDGDPYLGRTLGGRFTLQDIVGSGELGMVYRGVDQRSGQLVAVKIVHPDVAATHGDALLNAARAVAQVRHAKVATVLGATRAPDGSTFIVTEFLGGETLKTLLERTGPISPRRTADILFQLCSALAPIHRAGRPHANLKPDNVFLVPRDEGDDFVKIVDAGYPDLFGVRETAEGAVIIGSPKFFSPEQALGHPATLASDQFTLGIIGYQLLTGALPFFGATPDQLLSAIANGQPTPVGQRTNGVPLPDRLEAIIHRCLEKDPARRYPDLRSLATDLAAVIKAAQAAPAPAPAPRPPSRPAFGQGLNLSTVVASADMMASLGRPIDDDDDDSTVARKLPVDIEALLAGAGPASGPKGSGGMQSAPINPGAPLGRPQPPPPPTGDDLQAIPESLMFTGALDSVDVQAALAAAARGSGRASTPPSPPGRPAMPARPAPPAPPAPPGGDGVFDIGAALAAAAAEVDGPSGGASRPSGRVPAQSLTVLPTPVMPGANPTAAAGGGEFDPFAGLDLPSSPAPASASPREAPRPGAPPAGAARPAGPAAGAPGLASDIMSAIREELDPRAAAAPAPASANPLATAADFAALSPNVITRARDVQANVEAADRKGAKQRTLTLAVAGVALVGLLGAAAYYFLSDAPEAQPLARGRTSASTSPKANAGSQPASTPASNLPTALAVRITSTPEGARVTENGTPLGITPFELTLTTTAKRSLDLKAEGHQTLTQLVDPAALPAADATGAVVIALALKPGADPERPPTATGSEVPPQLAAVPGGKGVEPTEGAAPTEPEKPVRAPTSKGTGRRPGNPNGATSRPPGTTGSRPIKTNRPPRPATDPSKIKDPFAEE